MNLLFTNSILVCIPPEYLILQYLLAVTKALLNFLMIMFLNII